MMKKFVLFILLWLPVIVRAQQISYYFSAPNAAHHEAEIRMVVRGIGTAPAVFRMSRSSPGRYATHEFGKNVYNVRAEDDRGHPLPVVKTDGDVYTVPKHGGTIKLWYTLYGNYADGTYDGIDATNYHLNMPATFMWIKGFDNAPITVHFDMPEQWRVATQLKRGKDQFTFTAAGLQLFMDSPVKMGRLLFSEWEERDNGKTYKFRLAVEAKATQAEVDELAKNLKKVVETERSIYGELPDYDNGTYTFIASINPFVHGDGMEHRNSTMITIPMDFDNISSVPGVFPHEFFHCWNVERIRPKLLEPFDFEKSNMSDGLWLAEGFTLYYGDLVLVRAGFMSPKEYGAKLARLVNAKETRPGGELYSPIENSERAVFVDASVSIDKTNYANMYSSYYPYGGAIALALDLELRHQFNKSLDDFMRGMWLRFGKKEVPYTMDGVQEVLASITNAQYASAFFEKYIYGHERIDYKRLLEQAGYMLQKQNPGNAWIGDVEYAAQNDGVRITGNTVRNTPLYKAGLDVDDIITELDGKAVKQETGISQILAAHKPGDKMKVRFIHRGKMQHAVVTVMENPELAVLVAEDAGKTLTNAQKEQRRKWLMQ